MPSGTKNCAMKCVILQNSQQSFKICVSILGLQMVTFRCRGYGIAQAHTVHNGGAGTPRPDGVWRGLGPFRITLVASSRLERWRFIVGRVLSWENQGSWLWRRPLENPPPPAPLNFPWAASPPTWGLILWPRALFL